MSIGHFEYKFTNIRSDKMSFDYLRESGNDNIC